MTDTYEKVFSEQRGTHMASRSKLLPILRSLTVASVILAFLESPTRATAVDDTGPPQLVEFSISPAAVDTSAGPAMIIFTARFTDDLSGFHFGSVALRSPSMSQELIAEFEAGVNRVSGGPLDGTYQATVSFPQFSEQGTWTTTHLGFQDQAGNGRTLYPADLAAAGFPTSFINRALSAITVSPANPTIRKHDSIQFTATGVYSDGSTSDLTTSVAWRSSNTAVGVIDSGGLATGIAQGTTTITAGSGSVAGHTVLVVDQTKPKKAKT